MFLVVTLLAVTVVSAGAVMGPQISSLKGAVNGRAGFDISLAALDTRSLLYDSAGNEIFRFVDDGSNRELLALEDMPEQLITAVVTIEDAEFFSHPGINLRATFRALVENVGAGGISQGGSTISQQLIKNRVLTEAEREERS
ncbi:transglycosylase domain-containing protein, partial [Acidimicrobiales bacterium]|nr:transglycosylase domain-containing protein [Acidimicrobiaceae bacterium]MDB9846446.1 transglycosylase domain-containing protein [Acidimicrobiales bacterium]